MNQDRTMKQITNLSLVIENYVDNTGNNINLFDEINLLISELRKNKDTLTDSEKKELIDNILEKINYFIEIAGKDKFIYYEDGTVEYKWDYSLLKEEK